MPNTGKINLVLAKIRSRFLAIHRSVLCPTQVSLVCPVLVSTRNTRLEAVVVQGKRMLNSEKKVSRRNGILITRIWVPDLYFYNAIGYLTVE